MTGKKKNLHFKNKDILNKQKKVAVGTKMHFEVIRRGGRCVAIKINVIDTSEEMVSGWKETFFRNSPCRICSIRKEFLGPLVLA